MEKKDSSILFPTRKIIKYIDCDGVIMDTQNGLFHDFEKLQRRNTNLSGLEYLANMDWEYWINQADVINDSIDIIKEQDPTNVILLTKVHSLNEGKEKIRFFRNNGLKNNIILVPNGLTNSAVVSASRNILVDDFKRNLVDWENSNGVPILFNPYGDLDDNYDSISSLNEIFTPEFDEKIRQKVLTKSL
ncbi:MAG: hypothetical protein R3Y21_02470 [Mycoplasmatota bacterium]